ncbi:SAF domain-containing protein [Pseudonocardia abyssalis]|uniref:SAF domain-containing protein n=1 Tax=Pseudonocardia abyssalis TaxID=2792008 RepID=UPI001CF60E7D|nr:SAF domain-containing protein [Pseudonocardia abyssalis]
MTATVARPPERVEAATPRPLRPRRSSRRLLLAVTLGLIGALLGAYAYRGAVVREGVVAMARPLSFGSVVQLSDLREIQLPLDSGLTWVTWDDVGTVLGQLAATDLRAGQTLTPDSVSPNRVPAPGEAVVGLSVEAGRVPSAALAPRDEVLIITGAGSPPKRATVVRAGDVDVSGRRDVDVLVPQADAEELALASVDNRVAIVLLGRG